MPYRRSALDTHRYSDAQMNKRKRKDITMVAKNKKIVSAFGKIMKKTKSSDQNQSMQAFVLQSAALISALALR